MQIHFQNCPKLDNVRQVEHHNGTKLCVHTSIVIEHWRDINCSLVVVGTLVERGTTHCMSKIYMTCSSFIISFNQKRREVKLRICNQISGKVIQISRIYLQNERWYCCLIQSTGAKLALSFLYHLKSCWISKTTPLFRSSNEALFSSKKKKTTPQQYHIIYLAQLAFILLHGMWCNN